MGSDLFYEPFKEDCSLLTIEECRKSEELVNTIKYSRMFVYKICLFSFGHHDVESPVWLQVPGRLEERWDHQITSNTQPKTWDTMHITPWPAPYQTAETLNVNSSFLWLFLAVVWEDVLTGSEMLVPVGMLVELDLWANSVSFVHKFQWVWTDSYLCVLVTRAIFHRGITPLIGRLCCVQVRGPLGGKSKWLCPISSVSVSLCLLSCWYKEPCVEQQWDVWIYLSSALQLFLRMCRCLFFGWGVAERVWTLRLDFCEKRSWWGLFGPGSHLQGPSFPRGITPIWCPMSMIVLPWDTFDLNSSHIIVTISDILLSFVPVQWKDHSVPPNSSSCILQQSIDEASTTHLFFPDLFYNCV